MGKRSHFQPKATETRTESDTFGPIAVPADRYWGAQTQRSIQNFPIGGERQPLAIVHALGTIKQACAEANKKAGALDAKIADAIIQAAGEVIAGDFDEHFPLVLVGRSPAHADITTVDVDNVHGASMAVRHLAQMGYARIATITGHAIPRPWWTNSREPGHGQ